MADHGSRLDTAELLRDRRQSAATLDLIRAMDTIVDKHELDEVDILQIFADRLQYIAGRAKSLKFEKRRK